MFRAISSRETSDFLRKRLQQDPRRNCAHGQTIWPQPETENLDGTSASLQKGPLNSPSSVRREDQVLVLSIYASKTRMSLPLAMKNELADLFLTDSEIFLTRPVSEDTDHCAQLTDAPTLPSHTTALPLFLTFQILVVLTVIPQWSCGCNCFPLRAVALDPSSDHVGETGSQPSFCISFTFWRRFPDRCTCSCQFVHFLLNSCKTVL